MFKSRRLVLALLGAVAMIATVVVAPASGHESGNDGHIPPNTNYGFEVIGRDVLEGITDGKYTDVWSQDGYAYIGTFQDPECTTSGVFVVDLAAAIANYPNIEGATVAEIKSPPDTRINDVKTITIGDQTVLITTEEPCGAGIEGGAVSDLNINKPCPIDKKAGLDEEGNPIVKDCNRANDNGNKNEPGRRAPGAASQHGRGGISLWDVTNPEQPKPLEKSFLDFRGVHNTFPWTGVDGGTYLLGVADTFDLQDLFIVDISDPANPELLLVTGLLDWLDGFSFAQLGTGSFNFLGLHDVWVENIDGADVAVLPYWDAGYITLDVSDPANPVFLGDSDYPATDPLGRPYEGNAHAAVFGANGDIIVAGDEDFDPASFAVTFEGVEYPAGSATFGPSVTEVPLAGEVIWTGGEGCTTGEVPAATADGQIALMQRGSCFFQDKVDSAEAQGYAGAIIANDAARGDALLTMAPRDADFPTGIPSAFVGFSTGELMKEGGSVSGAGLLNFDGWGYLRVLNNINGTVTVPDQVPGPTPTTDVGYLGEIGYYAPAETLEADLGGEGFVEFGDLTMHNVEADPTTQDIAPTFDEGPRFFVSWYSLGMRAIEYRPGHFHDNSNGEGSYSWNVHEVGRFIAEDGSNFWGVHVDTVEIDGEQQQIILGSDRNTGLWIFTFGCEGAVGDTPFYCEGGTDD